MTAASLASRYDAAILDPAARALYQGSGFFNVGDWRGNPVGLGEAASRLVQLHLSVDPPAVADSVQAVLDVGCGLGAAAAMMAEHYRNSAVVGVNLSPDQLACAAVAAPRARFAAMDAVRLAIADGSIDRLHCIEAAFHFDSRDAFLAEIARVLRVGGKAILTDITFRRSYAGGVPAANVWQGEEEYRSRCEAAGLRVEQLADITERTLAPFFRYLEEQGLPAQAAHQRRAMAAYYFVVLGRACDPAGPDLSRFDECRPPDIVAQL
jgi:ubiquinone/menaquinone biosynthesis C-methylase UbiE